ncbi:arrestin domain-containing protein 3-like [Ostrea edulis]|uniref:arrestin domain-containing protein 3-like n=1 Tax=Ostrea edulis TaxID=37623 RepID=UPI0024AEB485|nr:arrestin domain-containing protein 3-like [Ostrea edulis]XP_056022795.1 arrestin domain-containing protein 3-like [Ostrea edulis]
MGKLKSFQIDFDNVQGVFAPGQTITGRAVVDLESEMKMKEIRVSCVGKAHVGWSEHHGGANGGHTVHYWGNERYFDNTVPLFGKGLQGGDEYNLPPGQHAFPFSFILPPNLPSSFEGKHGYVRYKIKGTIDRPWRFDDHTVRPFTVLQTLDLNQEPLANNSGGNQNSKFLCCLCCKSGPIEGTVTVNRVGYVPGESVYFEASAQNNSRRVCGMFAELVMVTSYHAQTPRKTRDRKDLINRIQHQDLTPGHSDVWSGERFVIPPLAPSYLAGCNIIDIKYFVKLVIDPSGPAFDLEVPVEIIIGTIPLQSAVQQYQQMHSATAPSVPPAMPTPTYTESIWGPTNIIKDEGGDHTQGQMEFTPTYSYYKWS